MLFGQIRPFSQNLSKQGMVKKICLTGGPCAGKTTTMTKINNILTSRGYRMFLVPEAATIMLKAGCIIDGRLGDMTDDFNVEFSSNLMRTQIALEDILMDVARAE